MPNTLYEAVIHWKIGNVKSHGSPIPVQSAIYAAKEANLKYGEGTHWVQILPKSKEDS